MEKERGVLRKFIAGVAAFSLVGLYVYPSLQLERDSTSYQVIEAGGSQENITTDQQLPLDRDHSQQDIPKFFGDFNIINPETIEVDFDADTLLSEPTLFYLDPISGDVLESAATRTVSNLASKTISSSVEIKGTKRPLTITIADDAVFMTLPYTGGVLTGEGSLESITLRKQKPMTDFVKDEVIQTKISDEEPLQRVPVCLNC